MFYILYFILIISFLKYNTATNTSLSLAVCQRLQGHSISNEFLNYLQNVENFESTRNENTLCLSDLITLEKNVRNGSIWALRVIDAWGNIPAGLLQGRLTDLGNFDECIGVYRVISEQSRFQGKYCLAKVPLKFDVNAINVLSSIQIGTCLPDSCTANQTDAVIKRFFAYLFGLEFDSNALIVSEENCVTSDPIPLSGVAVAAIAILSTLIALVAVSTLYDYLFGKSEKSLHPLLKAFSVRVNARALFRIVDNRKNPNVISCLNGIRCMSLIWVIFCHDFELLEISPNMNTLAMYSWVQTPFAMFVTQGFLAVESFFFLSGLLVVMVALRELERSSGKLNVPLMYLHRILRLTPVLGYSILVYMSLKYMSDGPLWRELGWQTYEVCNKNWWGTLLYVQNYVDSLIMCVGHSWYLAVDMQLYLASPIFIFALYKWGNKAVISILGLMIAFWAWLFLTIWIYDYTLFYKKPKDDRESMKRIYFPTEMRTSPWLLGVVLGYYLHKIKGQKVRLSKFTIVLGWLASFSLLFGCIFALYPKSQMSATYLTAFQEALFISLSRIAWPLGLCWIVFANVQDYGGPVNRFLAHSLWQPLARLSYCMYIFHFVPLRINGASIRANTNFSSYDLMKRIWPNYGFTILIAVLMYLTIEAPMSGLEEYILPSRKKPMIKSAQLTTTSNQLEPATFPETGISNTQ